MPETVISTKGQVVIPKDIRQRHGWSPGTELQVEDRDDCVVLRRTEVPPRSSVDDLLGCLPHEGPPKTLGEMEEGIARGARRRR